MTEEQSTQTNLEVTQPLNLETVMKKASWCSYTSVRLTITRPNAETVDVPMDRHSFTMGRHETSDVVLKDGTVSNKHAKVSQNVEEGYFQIENLGAKNGIIFEGSRVEKMILVNGDSVVLGKTVVQFHLQ